MLKDNWLERQITTVRELIASGSELIRENKLVKAENNFREAEVILDSAEDITPVVLELKAAVFNELGVIATHTNDATRALKYHKLGLEVARELAEDGSDERLAKLAASNLNLGGVLAALQRFHEAEQHNRDAIAALDKIDAPNDSVKLMRIGALQNLGIVLSGKGEGASGLEFMNQAEATMDEVLDGENDSIKPSLIQILVNASISRLRNKEFDAAVRLGEKASTLSDELYEKHKSAPLLNHALNAQMNLITVYQASSRFDRAEDALFRVLEVVPGHEEVVKRGVAFYKEILAMSDEELEAGGLPREEAQESLDELVGE